MTKTPCADPQTLWSIWRAPLRGAQENRNPRLATHEKLTGHLHPHPLPPPRRRLWELFGRELLSEGGRERKGGRLAEFAMSRQERGREGLGLPRSRIPEGGAIISTQRPPLGPAAPSYSGLPPSSPKGPPRPRVPRQHSPQPLST